MEIVPFARIQELVPLESVIEPVREAFKSYSQKKANNPQVLHLEMPECEDGALHIKCGHVAPQDFCVVKVAASFPSNIHRPPPRPSIDGMIAIFSAIDGHLLAILDDRAWITQMRTAGAGAVSLLARQDAATLGVIGSGVQARLQARAALHVRPTLDRVLIWGRTPAHVAACATDLSSYLPGAIVEVVASREQLVRESDILVTATYATDALVQDDWLREGVLVIAMGADSTRKREVDSAAFLQADRVIVDSRSQNLTLGEIGYGIRSQHFTASRMDAELGEVLVADSESRGGVSLGRGDQRERIICKLTGVAVQEIFVCARMLESLGLVGLSERE